MQRIYTTAAILLVLVPAAIMALLPGCGPDTQLGGVKLINALPDTRISGTPPYLRETSFTVHFYWTGNDPDGRIRGYQWKMSANGDDGISIRDTLTVDPATGDTLNPWRYTTVTDSTFFVSADSSGFEPDATLPEQLQRFYQPHTLFVRSVDDQGAVDPTPAMITFTSTTLAPTVRLTSPTSLAGGTNTALKLPPVYTLGWTGTDPDFELGTPTKVRYLLKRSEVTFPDGTTTYVRNKVSYDQYVDQLVQFNDPLWSDWVPYNQDADVRKQTFQTPMSDAEGNPIYYLFALQAQDTAGAVSLDRSYFGTVYNFYLDNNRRPLLVLRERYLGTIRGAGLYGRANEDIAQNQPLQFEWFGTAEGYGGEIAGYRYGWDVDDLTYDDDPGWETQFGLAAVNMKSNLKFFDSGLHIFTVECKDNSGLVTRLQYYLNVVPVPNEADRLPLILIDDVWDHTSQAWPDQSHTTSYDNDLRRDAFWSDVLTLSGGVAGFNPDRDVIDNESAATQLGYRDVVRYKTVLWTTRRNSNSYIATHFQPSQYIPQDPNADPIPTEAYVWLETYQREVGNVMLVGAGAIQNFHLSSLSRAGILDWLYPLIYNTDEPNVSCLNRAKAQSFGIRTEEDGSQTVFGTLQYPYRGLGFALTSMASPQDFYFSPNICGVGRQDRKVACVGTKAIVLDPDFKAAHVQAGAFQDSIFLWTNIDFRDDQLLNSGVIPSVIVDPAFNFGPEDEIYDRNVTARTTPWSPQILDDGTRAVEPMWRRLTRYDWLLDLHLAHGDDDYTYEDPGPCGGKAISSATGRTVMDGSPIGVFSYMTTATKPGGKADVIWGFQPSSFDHAEIAKAIQWVLGEHFGLETLQ